MDISNIDSIVREIIDNVVNLENPIEKVNSGDNLFLLGMDSLDCVKVIVALENKFDFEFEDEDLAENFQSINSITRYISTKSL